MSEDVMKERVNIECRCGYVIGGIGEIEAWKAYSGHLEKHIAGVISEVDGVRRKRVPGVIVPDDYSRATIEANETV